MLHPILLESLFFSHSRDQPIQGDFAFFVPEVPLRAEYLGDDYSQYHRFVITSTLVLLFVFVVVLSAFKTISQEKAKVKFIEEKMSGSTFRFQSLETVKEDHDEEKGQVVTMVTSEETEAPFCSDRDDDAEAAPWDLSETEFSDTSECLSKFDLVKEIVSDKKSVTPELVMSASPPAMVETVEVLSPRKNEEFAVKEELDEEVVPEERSSSRGSSITAEVPEKASKSDAKNSKTEPVLVECADMDTEKVEHIEKAVCYCESSEVTEPLIQALEHKEADMSVPNLQDLNKESVKAAPYALPLTESIHYSDDSEGLPTGGSMNKFLSQAEADDDAYSVMSRYIEKCMSVPKLQELNKESVTDRDLHQAEADDDDYSVLSRYIEKCMSAPNLQDLNKESVATTATEDLTTSVEVHADVSQKYNARDGKKLTDATSFITPERSSIKRPIPTSPSRRAKYVRVPSSGSSVCSEITMNERSPLRE